MVPRGYVLLVSIHLRWQAFGSASWCRGVFAIVVSCIAQLRIIRKK